MGLVVAYKKIIQIILTLKRKRKKDNEKYNFDLQCLMLKVFNKNELED